MRRFNYSILVLMFVSTLTSSLLHAQNSQSLGLYCGSGLAPDGYIDFSGMPAAPVIPNGGSPSGGLSAPVTATLPVQGITGLTVTINIPALGGSGGPAYTVDGGTLQVNGSPATPPGATEQPPLITLTFSEAVAGLGVNALTSGRFNYSYILKGGLPGALSQVPSFVSEYSGYTLVLFTPETQHLQMAAEYGSTLQEFTVGVTGGEDHLGGTLSNFRVQSTSAPDPAKAVPTNGLQQWLRADIGNPGPFTTLTTWPDQSGQGHDAVAAVGHEPGYTVDGPHCQPAYAFNGKQSFDFNLPISGWSKMTVFLVAKAAKDGVIGNFSQSSAIAWTENAPWGATFVSPYQTHAYFRFGTTQVGNAPNYVRQGTIGQDFTVTRVEHNDNGVDNLYVNGVRVLQQTGKLPVLGGVSGAGTIGKGIQNSYYDGEISEILVYNRVLSANEAAIVENYLIKKYGLL
jgi:hypothetical protein